jgi:hypothetical protein
MGFALQGKKDTMKDNCKKLNLRLEKAVSTQAPWPMPDASFRKYLLVDKVAASVMPLYSNVWREFEHNHFKMQQKYVKCVFLCALVHKMLGSFHPLSWRQACEVQRCLKLVIVNFVALLSGHQLANLGGTTSETFQSYRIC